MVVSKPKSIRLRGHFRKWRDYDSLKLRDINSEFNRLREALPVGMFGRIVKRIEREHLQESLFQRREWKTWQEAWIAWHFAFADGATHLQLARENAEDDFYLKRRGMDWLGFQATEALLGGRQRSREYREDEASGRVSNELDGEEIARQSDDAVPAILRSLEDKSMSARDGHLVIYLNTGWIIDAELFIAELRTRSERYRSSFAEAWVIGKRSVFRLAPNFKMVRGPPVSLRGNLR